MRQTRLRHLFSFPFVLYNDQTAFNRYQRLGLILTQDIAYDVRTRPNVW